MPGHAEKRFSSVGPCFREGRARYHGSGPIRPKRFFRTPQIGSGIMEHSPPERKHEASGHQPVPVGQHLDAGSRRTDIRPVVCSRAESLRVRTSSKLLSATKASGKGPCVERRLPANEAILATTDLSARSDRAVDRALQLGVEFRLPVRVIHVQESKASQEKGRDLAAAVRSVLPDPDADVDILTPTGRVSRTIADAARAQNAALLVTGVARYNNVGDYVLGNAVEKIIGQAPAPVLVVKQRPHGQYERLLCAVDFSDHSGQALAAALRLFPDRQVIVLHAFHVPFESWQKDAHVREEAEANARRKFDAFLASLSLSEQEQQRLIVRLGYGNVGDVLQDEIDRSGADLVVFGTHGMGGFRQATVGSTASRLLQNLRPDALIVPPEGTVRPNAPPAAER